MDVPVSNNKSTLRQEEMKGKYWVKKAGGNEIRDARRRDSLDKKNYAFIGVRSEGGDDGERCLSDVK